VGSVPGEELMPAEEMQAQEIRPVAEARQLGRESKREAARARSAD
jgi:hypothetical protein